MAYRIELAAFSGCATNHGIRDMWINIGYASLVIAVVVSVGLAIFYLRAKRRETQNRIVSFVYLLRVAAA